MTYSCSFCGKNQDQVQRLIAGQGGDCICDECIDLSRKLGTSVKMLRTFCYVLFKRQILMWHALNVVLSILTKSTRLPVNPIIRLSPVMFPGKVYNRRSSRLLKALLPMYPLRVGAS